MIKYFKYNSIAFIRSIGIWAIISIAVMRVIELFDNDFYIFNLIIFSILFFGFHIYYLLKTKVFLNYWKFLLSVIILLLIFQVVNFLTIKFIKLDDYKNYDLFRNLIMRIINIIIASILYLISIVFKKIPSLKQQTLILKKDGVNFLDKILVVFSVIVILITLLFDFNYLQYKAPISHKDWKSITLDDFRGLRKPNMNLDGESKFATVSTSIYTKETSNTIQIEAFFHPARSYVYNRDLFANELLTHEMYHFHITEYCARLMRKEIINLINNNKPFSIDRIKNRIIIEEHKLQYQYDNETYHSYVVGKQIEWQNKIDSSLLSLNDYSNIIITLK